MPHFFSKATILSKLACGPPEPDVRFPRISMFQLKYGMI
jgi:hypothetical protein